MLWIRIGVFGCLGRSLGMTWHVQRHSREVWMLFREILCKTVKAKDFQLGAF